MVLRAGRGVKRNHTGVKGLRHALAAPGRWDPALWSVGSQGAALSFIRRNLPCLVRACLPVREGHHDHRQHHQHQHAPHHGAEDPHPPVATRGPVGRGVECGGGDQVDKIVGHGRSRARWGCQPFCEAIQRSTFASSTASGTEPSCSTSAWKPRMSNLSPSSASARARSSLILSSPIL